MKETERRIRPGLAAGIALALTAVALVLLPRLRVDPDMASLLPRDHPSLALLQSTGEDAAGSRSLYVLIRGEALGSKMDSILANLEASYFLTEVAGTKADWAGDAGEQARAAPLWFLPEESLAELRERLTGRSRRAALDESRALLAQDPIAGREIVLRDPLGLRWILARAERLSLPASFDASSPFLLLDGGRQAVIRVTGRDEAYDVEFSKELIRDLELRLHGFEPRFVGGYAIAREDEARIRGDLTSSLLWSIPLISVFLIVSTRSLWRPLFCVAPIALSVLWTLGIGGALLGPLTPLAVSSAAILMGLGVDAAIHWLERYTEERAGAEAPVAIVRTHRASGRALLGASLTSAAAFLSVSFGSFPGLRGFGVLLALGLVLALLATWIVLPLLLLYFERRLPSARSSIVVEGAARLLNTSGGKGLAWTLVATAVLGWILVFTKGLVFDANPEHLRPGDSEVVAALRDFEVDLGFAPLGVAVLVPADSDLEALAARGRELVEAEEVALAGGVVTAPGAARAELVAEFRASTSGWMDGALKDLAAAGFQAEPFRPALEELAAMFQGDPVTSEAPIEWSGASYQLARMHPARTPRTDAEREELFATLRAAFGEGAVIADPSALAGELGDLLAEDLSRSMLLCAGVVLLFVILSIGAPLAGLVALIPALCGAGAVLGALAYFAWPLHPGNFIAVPLILGLGVDDGIHMVRRFREGGGDPLRTTGRAVWRTTVTTCLGFGALVTADSPAIASMGALVLAGTLLCFFATVLVVPYLLRSHANTP